MTETTHTSDPDAADDVAADGTGVETGGQQVAIAADSKTSERLVKAVGTFLVLGTGFVLTLFLAGQFAGGGGSGIGGGSLFGSSGALAGFGLAVIFSPLLAVIVGAEIGREGDRDAVVDAGIATAVGFLVMFFVTLVLTASLSGSGAGSSGGIGPLIGVGVGVGITGAASAAVARWEQSFLDGVANPPLAKSIVFGALTYLVFGVGFVVAIALAGALSSGGGSLGGVGAGALSVGLVAIGILLAPMIAIVVGLFAGRDGLETPGQAAISGAIGSAVGSLLLLVALLIGLALLQPTGGSIPIPVGPIVGVIVGCGLTGAGAGYVGGR